MVISHLGSIIHQLQTNAGRHATLLNSAYDRSNGKRYLLSIACDGGPITHLMTLYKYDYVEDTTRVQHVNRLVLFTSTATLYNLVFVLNPSTREVFKIFGPWTILRKFVTSLGSMSQEMNIRFCLFLFSRAE
ncbi:hypothetical protein Hanom_Chr07g00608611 [Helianthus anomalus]